MNSHSQAGQDLFALAMCEGKVGGTFLDLGCNHPTFHNNSYLLESQCGWRGLLVDIEGGCEHRKSLFIKADATKPTPELLFQYSQMPPVVDYASIDCDDATVDSLFHIPWDRTAFRVITLETDVYKDPFRQKATRLLLHSLGYKIVCSNVVVEYPEGVFVPYEDWWCHPDLVNPDLITKYKSDGLLWKEILKR